MSLLSHLFHLVALTFKRCYQGFNAHMFIGHTQISPLTDIYPPVGRLNVTWVSQALHSIKNNTQLIQLLLVKTKKQLTISSITIFDTSPCLISV